LLSLDNILGQRHNVDQGPNPEDDVVAGSRALAAAVAPGASEDPNADIEEEEVGSGEAEEGQEVEGGGPDVCEVPAMLDGRFEDLVVEPNRRDADNNQQGSFEQQPTDPADDLGSPGHFGPFRRKVRQLS